jgi:hypothetical protein
VEVGKVGAQVPAEGAGEQLSLDVRQETEGKAAVERSMLGLLLLPFLPGVEDGAAAVLGEGDRAAWELLEVVRRNLLPVYEGEDEPVGEDGSELLHEVEGEGRPSCTEGVQVAHLGVQAGLFKGGDALAGKERVEEGQQRVDPVAGRASGALLEAEAGVGASDRGGEGSEVGGGCGALAAPDGVEGGHLRERPQLPL